MGCQPVLYGNHYTGGVTCNYATVRVLAVQGAGDPSTTVVEDGYRQLGITDIFWYVDSGLDVWINRLFSCNTLESDFLDRVPW